jgi:3-oxoadipate enol-lactonase
MNLSVNPPSAGSESCADRYLKVDDAVLRYRDEGQGSVVLFIHGWTLGLEMWEPQVAALHQTFRTVRFDRRGFGLSTGSPTLLKDVADIETLCRYLSIKRLALIGMSQGVRAALGFALSAPERISCLILDGPPDCLRQGEAADDELPLDHYRDLIRTQGIGAFRREWAMHPFVRLITGDRRQRDLLATMIARYRANDLLQSPATDGTALTPERIKTFLAPVLVITGEHDAPSRIEAANALAGKLPKAQRAVIPAAGHLANLDNPKHYNDVIGAFLERHAVALP